MESITLRGNPTHLQQSVKVIKALCHPVRLALAALLVEQGPLPVKDLQEALDISQSNVSQHLRKLEKAGLVGMEKMGNFNYYRIIHPMANRLLACADRCACEEEEPARSA